MRVVLRYAFRLVFYYFIYISNEISCAKISYNTFATRTNIRVTPFEAKVIAKTCLLKPDPGPCRGNIPMYYFEPSTMSCSKFNWGGCQGNGNRFDYMHECTETCLSKPNQKNSRPRWCSLTFDYGFCFGAIDRWYYDRLWKVCKKTIYSGCGGNRNNFYNKEECDSICRLGLRPLPRKAVSSNASKKVLIIDPWDTTPKRGKNQKTTKAQTDPNNKKKRISNFTKDLYNVTLQG